MRSLTGLRPQTLGIYDLPTNFRKSVPDAVTLPQHFKANGYRAEGLGKIFHVGHGNVNDEASWSVPHFSPKTISYALKENNPPESTREQALFENKKEAWKLPRGAPTENADVPDNRYGDGMIADEAIKRLAGQSEAGRAVFPRGGLFEAASAVRRAEEILGSLRSRVLQAAGAAKSA
jgi:iduronate 2-sulfatase